MPVGPPKMGGLWWRDLTECGPLEKGMANHFSILALRTYEQYEKQNERILKEELPRSVGAQYATGEITPERMKGWNQSKTIPSCGWDW